MSPSSRCLCGWPCSARTKPRKSKELREDLSVLSVYGSADGVLNRDNYEKDRPNLPADAQELVLEGGNHAQFGSYGEQQGDGEAAVIPERQWEQTVEVIPDHFGIDR